VIVQEPELDELAVVLGDRTTAKRLSVVAGGWRTLSEAELVTLGLSGSRRRRVRALQRLVKHGYPRLALQELATPERVGAVYSERLGDLVTEVMVVVALDGRNRVLAELEVARGGRHGMSLTVCDVLRPLIRIGATAFILVHNHPSGSPEPSTADIEMTYALAAAAEIVGVPLVDHVVVAARGGGFASLGALGLLPTTENEDEQPSTRRHRAVAAERR
jgi:DNA repair protein RadC